MFQETERLLFRPWKEEDAEELYELAKNPKIGPRAGWPVHTSVEHSKAVIQGVLSAEGTYAMILKESGKVVGSIGHMFGTANCENTENEAEIGYWIGEPYWGQGLMPEAVKESIRYLKEERGMKQIWCAYFEGNEQSKRVQEKCGFVFHHKREGVQVLCDDGLRVEYVNLYQPNITTIIFDMDGTLIDTEKYYRIFWPKALAEFGYTMTDEQALSMRSLGRPFAPVRLKEMFGEELDYYAVRDKRKEMMEECLDREGIQLKPGVIELLEYLKAHNIQTAIATATDLERTNKYLDKLGIKHYFTHLISATMVKEGKPSPDIYLYACEQLGKKPEECFAVEDSPNGATSAYRAGCKVIYVPDQTPCDEELKPLLYACVDRIDEIMHLI